MPMPKEIAGLVLDDHSREPAQGEPGEGEQEEHQHRVSVAGTEGAEEREHPDGVMAGDRPAVDQICRRYEERRRPVNAAARVDWCKQRSSGGSTPSAEVLTEAPQPTGG
jgi:hypothetical protein